MELSERSVRSCEIISHNFISCCSEERVGHKPAFVCRQQNVSEDSILVLTGSLTPEGNRLLLKASLSKVLVYMEIDVIYSAAHFNNLGAPGFHGLLGIKIQEVSETQVVGILPFQEKLLAGNGFVHAGSLITLADTCCGYGCISRLPETAKSFTTIEIKSNFLAGSKPAFFKCFAKPMHLGKSTQVWDATIISPDTGKTVALFRCTQMIIY